MKKILLGMLLAVLVSCTTASSRDEEVPVPQPPAHYSEVEQVICGLQRGDNMVNEELANKVAEKVKALLQIANKKYDGYYFDYPVLTFDLPAHLLAAGYYDSNTNTLLINPLYLNRFGEQFIEEVVTHEVAHLVVRSLGSNEDAHGPTWIGVMTQTFKVKNPKPYHHYVLCP